MSIFIVKTFSRLGMKYLPSGGDVLNIGVENGASSVIDPDFTSHLSPISLNEVDFVFSLPENTTDENYYSIVAKETDKLAELIYQQLTTSNSIEHLITIGGDHSIALGSLLGVLRSFPNKKIGVIDFDSHGDIHLTKTSPTGNFHGMWLRPLFGDFDNTEIKKIIGNFKIKPNQLLYIGNLILEDEEERFITENKINVLSGDSFTQNDIPEKQIGAFCDSMDMIHVTFDIDVFKKSLVQATGTPNPDGFDLESIERATVPILNSGKFFSIDLVEVNPKKDGAKETIFLAQKIINLFLGKK